jgi:transposase
LLAEEMVKKRIVGAICAETVSYWLRTADVKPHRCRYWLTSNDPDFEAKKSRIVDLYLHPPTDGVLISVDEKTCIQALERIGPRSPARPGRSPRVGFEYKRHGLANLLAAFEVTTGRVFARIVDRNDSASFIRFLRLLIRRYPSGKIYLVLDNGSSHRSQETKAFFEANPRLVPVFTPTHASWLNQVEIWFSLLGRQVLKSASFDSRDDLISRIMSYVKDYNRRCEPFQWTSKCEPLKGRPGQLRRRAKRRAPSRRRLAIRQRRQRAA